MAVSHWGVFLRFTNSVCFHLKQIHVFVCVEDTVRVVFKLVPVISSTIKLYKINDRYLPPLWNPKYRSPHQFGTPSLSFFMGGGAV